MVRSKTDRISDPYAAREAGNEPNRAGYCPWCDLPANPEVRAWHKRRRIDPYF